MSAHGSEKSKYVVRSYPQSPVSTCSDDLMSRVDIAEITDIDDYQSLSTSAVLFRCKHKILKPYLKVLTLMGLRSFGLDRPNLSKTVVACSYFHLFQVIVFTLAGYVLQYVACFRRDHGFCEIRNVPFGFVFPSVLHFTAFAYVLYLLRFKETEKLENLMEKTFLLSAKNTDGLGKANVLRSLWTFISFTIFWLVLSVASVVVLLLRAEHVFQFLQPDHYKLLICVGFILSMLWQDMVQATIITSYCLQAQLLVFSLCSLRSKLLQHTIQPLSWIREINECQSFLFYLNNDFSPSVCILIFLNVSYAVSSVFCLSRCVVNDQVTVITDMIIVSLWLIAGIVPFIMAAWLTSACTALRHLGHEVRMRPFVYQDTPEQDLDTILLYTSTLKLSSTLFGVPVEGRYLFACITLIGVTVMIVGMNRLL